MPGLYFLLYDRRNEIAGDHKEDVYTYKAALKPGDPGMEEDNGQHGDCSQPVDVAPVFH